MGKIERGRKFSVCLVKSELIQHLTHSVEAVGIFALQNFIALAKPRTLSEVIPFD